MPNLQINPVLVAGQGAIPRWLLHDEVVQQAPAILPPRLRDLNDMLVAGPNNPLSPNYKYGPELWDQLLEGVREIYAPEWVIVAGGAVRDHLLKVPPKDVDIFMKPSRMPENAQEFLEQAQCLGWQDVRFAGNPERYGNVEQVKLVLQGGTLGHQVELIATTDATPEDCMKKFDFAICQCWYDGQVRTTGAASVDLKKKQWTPIMPMDEELKKRFDRVNGRLGGIFKLNVNDEPWYQKFAGKEKVK